MKDHTFDWLVPHLKAATTRLEAEFPKEIRNLRFETPLQQRDFTVEDPAGGEDQCTNLVGRADIIQFETPSRSKTENVTIWEIKFVSQLSLEHVIQASIYGYLWCNKVRKTPRIVLFNVRDGEKWEIVPREGAASLEAVVKEIVVAKYTTEDTLTTDEFLKKCAKTKAEVEKAIGRAERLGREFADC
jgi:hypothetical protein